MLLSRRFYFAGAILTFCAFSELKISPAVRYLKMGGDFSNDNFENPAGLSKVSFPDSNNSPLLQAMRRQGPLEGLNIFPLDFAIQGRVAVGSQIPAHFVEFVVKIVVVRDCSSG